MKIVLQKDIAKLGKKGDIKEVASGYAQNYLIKNNLAVLCTQSALYVAEKNKTKQLQQVQKQKEENKELINKIKKTIITTTLKTGKDGSIFSSVSIATILLLLKKQGIVLEKSQIVLARPIKTLGDHKIKILLADNMKAEFLIKVEKE